MITSVVVRVTGPAVQEIHDQALRAIPKETGGLLLGWWHEGGGVTVRHAIEVHDPKATRISWLRRPRPARNALDQALQALQHPLLGYVGDWHTHPEACPASSQDLQSILETSRQYEQPILLLVHRPAGQLDSHAALKGCLIRATLDTAPQSQGGS